MVCLSVCVCVLHIFVHMCVDAHANECSCRSQRSMLGFFLFSSPPYFVRQCLPLDLEFAGLVSQHRPCAHCPPYCGY